MSARDKFLLFLSCAFLVLSCVVAAPAPAAAEPIDTLQAQLAEAQEHLSSLGTRLQELEGELSAAEEVLEETRTLITATEQDISKTQLELQAARATLSARMRSGYKTGVAGLLDVLMGADSLEDLANRIYYMDKVNEQDARNIERVRDLEEQLEAQRAELAAEEDTQEQNLASTQERVEEYEALVADAQAYYDQLDAEVQAELARIAAEEEARRQAEAEEAARRAAEEAATAAKEEQPSSETASEAEGADATGTADSASNSGVSTAVNAVTTATEAQQTQEQVAEESGGELSNYTPSYSASVVSNAAQFIGWPYKWGCYGTDMGGFDCCGLVATAYHLAGYSTPYATGVPGLKNWVQGRGNWKDCDLSNYQEVLSPGDIIFCSMGHVAIYVGGNQMIHAPYPGQTVCYSYVFACIGGGFGG